MRGQLLNWRGYGGWLAVIAEYLESGVILHRLKHEQAVIGPVLSSTVISEGLMSKINKFIQ